MEITKKHCTIIAVVIAVIVIWYFFLRKKKVESNYGGFGRVSRALPVTSVRSGVGTISSGGGGVQNSLSPCAKNPNGTWVSTPCCKMCNTSDAADIVM